MIIRDKYFTYPVIREHPEDYQKSTFKVHVDSSSDEDNILMRFKFELENEQILQLIKNNKAKFVVHLEEPTTMFREIFAFSTINNEIQISKDKIRMNVELSTFIVVTEDVLDFKSDDLDLIYEGIPISFDKYSIIGVGQSKKIEVNKESDEIKEVSSIFSVIPTEEENTIIKIQLSNERIIIEMPKKEYDIYYRLAHIYRVQGKKDNYILLSLVIIPSFVEALTIIKEDVDSYRNNMWFKPLINAYGKINVDLEKMFKLEKFSAYELTQKIFDRVLNKGLERLGEDKNVY